MVGLVNQPSEAYFVQIMHWTKLGKLDMMPNHIKTWQRRCWLQVLFSCPQVFLLLPCPKNDGSCRWRLICRSKCFHTLMVQQWFHLVIWNLGCALCSRWGTSRPAGPASATTHDIPKPKREDQKSCRGEACLNERLTWLHEENIHASSLSSLKHTASKPVSKWEAWLHEASIGTARAQQLYECETQRLGCTSQALVAAARAQQAYQ